MPIRVSMVTLTRIMLVGLAGGAVWGARVLSDYPGGRAWVPAVEKWSPVGMIAAAFLLLLAAVFWPWLAHGTLPAQTESPKPPRTRRWEPIALLALLGLTSWVNAPRMHHPLWGDEERTMRNYVVGQYKPAGESAVKWRACIPGDTLWDYQSPNNHGFYSLLARWAHGGRQPATGALDLPFSEWKLRLPAQLASILGLAVTWVLMRRWGFGTGAWVAVAVMAAHPWFTRYGTEARGYGLLFLLWPLALLSAGEAMKSGLWRWWLALGVLQALLFWTWMLQLHWLVGLNLAMAWQLARGGGEWSRIQARRWLVAGLVTGIILLPLQLPAVVQLMEWMETGKAKMPPGAAFSWLADVVSTALSGEPWHSPDPGNPLCPGRSDQWEQSPVRVLGLFFVPFIVLLAGTWSWIHGANRRWLPAMVLPLAIVLAQSLVKQSVLLPWYASPALPAIAMLAGAGAEKLTRPFGRWQAVGAIVLAACLVLPGRRMSGLLRAHPMEPTMEATLLTRRCLNPGHADFGTDSITVQPQLARPGYDPLCRKADNLEELKEAMEESANRDVPLYVHLGDPRLLSTRAPEFERLLDDPAYFAKIGEFPGMDGPQRRVVWKWTGRKPEP